MRSSSLVSVLGILDFGITVVALHFLPTGYSPLTEAVSDYGVGAYAAWMDAAFLGLGVGTVALAFALTRLVPSFGPGRIGVVLLGAAGVCIFGTGFFPTDLEGSPAATMGIVHSLLSGVAFFALIFGSFLVSRSFRRVDVLSPFYRSSLVLSIAIVVAFLTALPFGSLFGYLGVGERIFILTFYAWLLLTALRVARLGWK